MNVSINQDSFQLSDRAEDRIRKLLERYPSRKSAVMGALYIAQEELGWISNEAVLWVANRLELAPVQVQEVATFYTMYYKEQVGKYHIQLCRTLSCMLCGGKKLAEVVKNRCNLQNQAVHSSHVIPEGAGNEFTNHAILKSENGFWSFEEVECLGSCGTAPMMQINDVFFENLTEAKLLGILDRIEKEEPNLRYSTIRESLGKGLPDLPRSEVW